MIRSATALIETLSSIQIENVFNPYTDRCAIHDRADAPYLRRQNLERSLAAAVELEVKTIWVARDLGYRGGRRTGLALTDEVHLDAYSALFRGVQIQRATKGTPVGERTANVIWQMLSRIGEPVFLWNVFPLHPHLPDDPMSNRSHTARERDIGREFLEALLDLLDPDKVIAIGGDAQRAIESMGITSTQVRHPSYGGQNVFIRQIEDAYNLRDEVAPDLFSRASAV